MMNRWVGCIAMLLIIGLAVNVIVAVRLSHRAAAAPASTIVAVAPASDPTHMIEFGRERGAWMSWAYPLGDPAVFFPSVARAMMNPAALFEAETPATPPRDPIADAVTFGIIGDQLPMWPLDPVPQADAPDDLLTIHVKAGHGWPLPAIVRSGTITAPLAPTVFNASQLSYNPSFHEPRPSPEQTLAALGPARPLWLGLVVNTPLYAALAIIPLLLVWLVIDDARERSRRSNLRRLAWLVVLSNAAAIASSWLLVAVDGDPLDVGGRTTTHRHAESVDGTNRWWTVNNFMTTGAHWTGSFWTGDGGHQMNTNMAPGPAVPAWAPFLIPDEASWKDLKWHHHEAWAYGWPWPALWHGRVSVKNSAGAMEKRDFGAINLGGVLVPIRPIWPGYLNNVLVAAITIILLAGISPMWTVRSRRRLRRGQCPRCGYPAGVNPVCTECGRDLPAGMISASAMQPAS